MSLTNDLVLLRATQQSVMFDTCKVLTYSSTTDALGNPVPAYTSGSAISCGFRTITAREIQESGYVPILDGEMRLPVGTIITSKDRIQLTKRYGENITAQTYEIVGPAMMGPTGYRVSVKLVTDA